MACWRLPEIGFIIDIGDFLHGLFSGFVCVEFLRYFALSLLQFIEEGGRDGQEVAAGKFKDFAGVTERSAYAQYQHPASPNRREMRRWGVTHDDGLVAELFVVVEDLLN